MAVKNEKILKNDGKKFLTLREAANLLRISSRTIYRWRKQGKIKTIRSGQTVRISVSELQNLNREEE